MRARVDHAKRISVRKYERYHEHTIKNYDFQPGRLFLVRFTQFKKTVSGKMKPRYLGPMVIIKRTKGGAYLVAEMNSAMFQERVTPEDFEDSETSEEEGEEEEKLFGLDDEPKEQGPRKFKWV
jgi:hypothetical protein